MNKIHFLLMTVVFVATQVAHARNYVCDLELTNAATYGIYGTHFDAVHSDISGLVAISNFRSDHNKHYSLQCRGTGPAVDRLNQGIYCAFSRRIAPGNPSSDLELVTDAFAQDGTDKFYLSFRPTQDIAEARIVCVASDR